MKALIIGGVAAGMSAASKLRRLRKDAQITVYERGSFLSYGACGIPYYVGGFNDDPDLLIARSREDFEKQGIRTFLRHE
ncbi:MAG: FAD-dependent oxidoreductase, partial [Clostridiales bacterium]|nr:FAD-dependent oxidoreductase [Clostridiales bacterium]